MVRAAVLRLRRGLRAVVRADEEVVYLLGERRRYVLEGRPYRLVAPLLDGVRTADEVVAALEGEAAEADVRRAVETLVARGYAAEGDEAPPADRSAAVRALGLAPSADSSAGAEIETVCVEDYLLPDLEGRNRAALVSGRAWLLAKPVGEEVFVGPVFVPGRTACWSCLAERLRRNREIERAALDDDLFPSVPPAPTHPATVEAARAAADAVAARWRGGDRSLEGRILSLNVESGARRTHEVLRRPQCPACGDPAPRPAAPVEIRPDRARGEIDLDRHVSPLTGIVASVRPDPRGGVALAGAPVRLHVGDFGFRRTARSLAELRRRLRSKAAGTGRTDAEAGRAAAAEAIERVSAEWTGEHAVRRAALLDLGPEAVPPNDVMLFSTRQVETRAADPGDAVPAPLSPDEEIDWTAARALATGRTRFVPSALVFHGHPDVRFAAAESTGCAAGRTIEEAVLGALLEAIERDAAAIWWWNRLRAPPVDESALCDPFFAEAAAFLRGRGRTLALLDLTTDVGVPVAAAVSADAGPPLLLGFGAALDAGAAARRAAMEIFQNLVNGGAPVRPAPHHVPDPSASRPAPPPGMPPLPEDASAAAAVDRVVERLAACGLEALVVDLTRPDVGVPVARVVVPGLRPHRRRLAPGRLYDVPVLLGRRSFPLDEADVNPDPLVV